MDMSITKDPPAMITTKRRASTRQKKTFANYMANGGNMKQAMLEAGFSPAYAKNSQKLIKADSFKDMLDLVSDSELLTQTRDIALSEDKRASLVAIDMLFKLKDRYPAGKLKVQEYEEELNVIQANQTSDSNNPSENKG